jgi:hypothetical protein
LLFFNYRQSTESQEILSINELAMQIRRGEVARVVGADKEVRVVYSMVPKALLRKNLHPLW